MTYKHVETTWWAVAHPEALVDSDVPVKSAVRPNADPPHVLSKATLDVHMLVLRTQYGRDERFVVDSITDIFYVAPGDKATGEFESLLSDREMQPFLDGRKRVVVVPSSSTIKSWMSAPVLYLIPLNGVRVAGSPMRYDPLTSAFDMSVERWMESVLHVPTEMIARLHARYTRN